MSKHILSGYFNFTRKERTGIIFLLTFIIIFLFLPFLFPYFISKPKYNYSGFQKEIAALNIKQRDSTDLPGRSFFDESNYENYYQPSEKNYYSKQPKGELFYFDPNTLSADGWIKLGVKEKTANTIQNYLSKGGRFYKPEDIGKIWGLHQEQVNRLLPYVRIEAKPANAFSNSKTSEPYKPYEKIKYATAAVDINEADTSAFIALPGIGSKLANRIISFREKLGGFYKMEQVGETYALPDSTFQKIKDKLIINNSQVKKININKATLDELKVHPYIRYNIANAIVQYRTLHGEFITAGDIKKIMIITDDIYIKLSPYLTVK